MEDNELFFTSIEDADVERLADGLQPQSDPECVDEDLPEDAAEDPHPERFYLACHKALVRLKRYAASSPSF